MEPREFAASTPARAAVRMPDGRELIYAELEAGANRLARRFRAAGLRRGDHIALCLENRPEFMMVAWAAQRSGLYYTPCSTRLTGEEIEYIVDDCGARAFIASEATRAEAEAVGASLELRLMLGEPTPGWTSFEEALRDLPAEPIDDESEGAPMLYTSGTTGRPKGVKPSLVAGSYPQPSPWLELCELFGLDAQTVFLSPAPLYHGAPLGFSELVQRVGGTVLPQERFEAEEFLALVERFRATFTLVVPTMFVRLLKLPAKVRERYDLSSLRGVLHGAAPCPRRIKEQMIDWWGPIVHEYYAGTEDVAFVHCDSEEWLAHPGTVGRSLVGPVHILDPEGNELPRGEAGGIYFEGDNFEYHRDPAKTAEMRDPGGRGWSTMGDIGYLDEDDFLYLTDRQAYTINSGGVNIYPRESEDVLVTHPAVADVAVFGIPDEEWGERVHAVVQPVAGIDADEKLASELVDYCRQNLASYKCPRAVEFRAELPRHDTGKLYKRALRDEFWRGRSLTG